MTFEAKGGAIDASAFWRVVGARPVGATVVTTAAQGVRAGFLGLSFAHVCATPPLVLVSASPSTSALEAVLDSGVFAVNVLPEGVEAMARAFGGSVPPEERFADGDWGFFVTGAPVLEGAAGVFDCRLEQTFQAHGATILLGRVEGARAAPDNGATLAWRGGYRDLSAEGGAK